MAYIFASNPDALAGQRNFYDTTNIQMAQRDQALRQKAEDDARQSYIFAQQQAHDDQVRAQQQAQQYQFAANQDARQAQRDATQAYQFGVGQKNLAAENVESKRRFDIGTGLTEKEIAAKGEQYKYEKGQKDFSELATAIQNGEISDPIQIDTLFNNLDEQNRNRGKAYLNSKLNGLKDDWQTINQAALLATSIVAPKIEEPKPVSHMFGLYSTTPKKPEQKNLDTGDAMKILASSNNKTLLQYQPLIQWNETDQKFEPITKPPTLGATNALPSRGAPVTPTGPAPVPAGVTPPFQFPFDPEAANQTPYPFVASPLPLTPMEPVVSGSQPSLYNRFAEGAGAAGNAVRAGAGNVYNAFKRGADVFQNMDFIQTEGDKRRYGATNAPAAPTNMPPVVQMNRGRIMTNSAQRVRVQSPDGRPGSIPVENLDAALKAGWKLAQ